jgi:hypothetical protein
LVGKKVYRKVEPTDFQWVLELAAQSVAGLAVESAAPMAYSTADVKVGL